MHTAQAWESRLLSRQGSGTSQGKQRNHTDMPHASLGKVQTPEIDMLLVTGYSYLFWLAQELRLPLVSCWTKRGWLTACEVF